MFETIRARRRAASQRPHQGRGFRAPRSKAVVTSSATLQTAVRILTPSHTEQGFRSKPHASRILPITIIGLAGTVVLAYLATPVTREVLRTTAPHTATDVERLGGELALGQTFVAPVDRLAELHVVLQRPLPADAFPLFFHLRHGRYAARDIRTVVLKASDVDAAGVLRVRFLPVPKSAGRPYVFVLEAPNAKQGALTAFRQIDSSIYEQGYLLFQNTGEVRQGDLEFALFSRQPRITFLRHAYRRPPAEGVPVLLPPFLTQQAFHPALFRSGVVGLLATAGFMIVLTLIRHPSRRPKLPTVIVLLMVGHVLLHAPFLVPYPGVNDEGSYLMDIQNLRAGYWPFRDTLAKGPLFLLLLAPVALFLPHTLLPSRLLVAGVSSLEIPLLYALGRELGGRGAGILAATLWALSPVAIAQTSQLFLQPFSLPLVTGALLVLLRQPKPASAAPPSRGRLRRTIFSPAVRAGILLALAYLTRTSSLAFVAPALLLCFLRQPRLSSGIRQAGLTLLGMGATLGIIVLLTLPTLGPSRAAVMLNLEAFLIGQVRGAGGTPGAPHLLPPPEILERFTAHGAVLFRTGMPLVLPWLAAVAGYATRLLRLPTAVGGALFFGLALPLLQRVYAANFFLTSDLAHLGPALQLLTTILVLLLGVALWWPLVSHREEPRRALRQWVVVGGAWFALLLMYTFFGRFRQQYHAEFLPSYILGSALLLTPLLRPVTRAVRGANWRSLLRPLVGLALLVTIATTLTLSFTPNRFQPHTGSIPHQTALDVARVLKAHSAPREEILTAQGLFTFYADRFLPFGASHPGWYLEERAGTVPSDLRRLFLPDKAELRRYVQERPIRLVAIDRRTREVYFSYDPDMQQLLAREFHLLATVENYREERPVEIWKRKE